MSKMGGLSSNASHSAYIFTNSRQHSLLEDEGSVEEEEDGEDDEEEGSGAEDDEEESEGDEEEDDEGGKDEDEEEGEHIVIDSKAFNSFSRTHASASNSLRLVSIIGTTSQISNLLISSGLGGGPNGHSELEDERLDEEGEGWGQTLSSSACLSWILRV